MHRVVRLAAARRRNACTIGRGVARLYQKPITGIKTVLDGGGSYPHCDGVYSSKG